VLVSPLIRGEDGGTSALFECDFLFEGQLDHFHAEFLAELGLCGVEDLFEGCFVLPENYNEI
jgi:hypothetical protein